MTQTSKQVAVLDRRSKFNEENRQFFYSLILIFLIPALIVGYTFWSIFRFQTNQNKSIEKRTIETKKLLAASFADTLDKDLDLQTKINLINKEETDLNEISILKPLDNGFQVTASSNESSIGQIYSSLPYTTAWVEKKDQTSLTKEPTTNSRSWSIIGPLSNTLNEETALMSLTIGLTDLDRQSDKTLVESLLLLGITIFFILLLLFNHFKFFQYAILFKKLKEVDLMKDDFISMASHELKTPMAGIKGYLGMIFEGVAGRIDTKAKDHLQKVLDNVNRLDLLVNALLDVSRLEQGRMQFEMQTVDVSKVINQVTSDIKFQADEKKLTINYAPLPNLPLIYADPERMFQVLDNLIGNAIKYTQKGGIHIYHRLEGNRLYTMVQDTGIGISKDDMKGLFGKLYRIRTEKTADVQGTGLGLWITKELILRMNGEIFVESRENVGSTFTVVLPIIKRR